MYSDAIVGRHISLAVGSAGVTVITMLLHTKSPFFTLMGMFQILLSFPLAYFARCHVYLLCLLLCFIIIVMCMFFVYLFAIMITKHPIS